MQVKKTYQEKLLDPRWQRRRLEILNRDEFTCKCCKNRESTLHIHHLVYNVNGNPWDVDDAGLITLCEDCHHLHSIQLCELGVAIIDSLLITFDDKSDDASLRKCLIRSLILKYPKQNYGKNKNYKTKVLG